jgi:hypothetical protein
VKTRQPNDIFNNSNHPSWGVEFVPREDTVSLIHVHVYHLTLLVRLVSQEMMGVKLINEA